MLSNTGACALFPVRSAVHEFVTGGRYGWGHRDGAGRDLTYTEGD